MTFHGHNAIVTGAGGGMGLRIAVDLLTAGATVTAIDLKPRPADLDEAACTYEQHDVTDYDAVQAVVGQAHRRHGRLDYIVNAAGVPDAARPVLFVGQAQVMTPMGAVPISFEIEAASLDAAIEKFGAAAEQAVQQTMQELQEMRREQASSLVIPDAAGARLPSPSDLLGRGRPRR